MSRLRSWPWHYFQHRCRAVADVPTSWLPPTKHQGTPGKHVEVACTGTHASHCISIQTALKCAPWSLETLHFTWCIQPLRPPNDHFDSDRSTKRWTASCNAVNSKDLDGVNSVRLSWKTHSISYLQCKPSQKRMTEWTVMTHDYDRFQSPQLSRWRLQLVRCQGTSQHRHLTDFRQTSTSPTSKSTSQLRGAALGPFFFWLWSAGGFLGGVGRIQSS